MALTDDSTRTWRDASTEKPPCNGRYVVAYPPPANPRTEVVRWSGQRWIGASHLVSHYAGPFDSIVEAGLWAMSGTVPSGTGTLTNPDKHKQALRELEALASLYGNPGHTANKLLEIVGELLEIK